MKTQTEQSCDKEPGIHIKTLGFNAKSYSSSSLWVLCSYLTLSVYFGALLMGKDAGRCPQYSCSPLRCKSGAAWSAQTEAYTDLSEWFLSCCSCHFCTGEDGGTALVLFPCLHCAGSVCQGCVVPSQDADAVSVERWGLWGWTAHSY